MKQKISLVLSGGGARGIAHIGVIEELEQRGYEIVSITGTSMGALVGGIYALGKLQEFKNWLYTLDKLKVFSLVDFSFSSQGLIKGDKVLNAMREFIPDDLIENMGIAYTAVAVDILNKQETVFTQGSIYRAIRASIAIPTLFTPVSEGKSLFVDGGVLNNLPIKHAKRVKGDLLVAVNVNATPTADSVLPPDKTPDEGTNQESLLKKFLSRSKAEESLGYFDLINRVIALMTEHIVQTSLEKYPPDILIDIPRDACSIFDFYRGEEMVEIGRKAAQESFGN